MGHAALKTKQEMGILDKAASMNIPLSVLLEVTHRCNLKCCHCYLPATKGEEEMSTEEIKGVLDQLAAAKCLVLTISGGEILIRDDVFEIANYAVERNFALRLFTNGTMINKQTADAIEKLHPFSVDISIYGANEATHDGITGVDGSFARSIMAIRLLGKRGVRTVLKCILLKQNLGQYKDIISLAEELGVAYQLNPCISPKLDGSQEPLTHRIDADGLERVFSDNGLNADFMESLEAGEARVVSLSETAMCDAGRGTCVISPGGQIYPCAALRIPFGNLRERAFEEIWYLSESALRLRALRLSDLPVCSKCTLSRYCSRCPGVALLEHGDLRSPVSFFCQMARICKSIAGSKQLKEVTESGS